MELSIRTDTDTAHPQKSVPIYLIHSLKQPVRNNPLCWCQSNKARIIQLLNALTHKERMLSEAASFTQEEGVTHEPENS